MLVVGGGILGVATAAACHDAGLGVVALIEADRLGAGATSGAAGLLMPDAHHGRDPDELVALGRSSLDSWRRWNADRPGGVGLLPVDWLGLAPLDDRFAADPSPAVQWLDADEVARLVPGVAPGLSGARLADQARLNPVRALARVAGGLPEVATGVAATAVRTTGGRVTAVETTAGTITPGAVVFATGTPPALDGLHLDIPADTVKGHLLVTEPAPFRLPGIVPPFATQLEDGSLLSGGTLDSGDRTPEVRADVIDTIRAQLVAALPAARRPGGDAPLVLLPPPPPRRAPGHRPRARGGQRLADQRALPRRDPPGAGDGTAARPVDRRR